MGASTIFSCKASIMETPSLAANSTSSSPLNWKKLSETSACSPFWAFGSRSQTLMQEKRHNFSARECFFSTDRHVTLVESSSKPMQGKIKGANAMASELQYSLTNEAEDLSASQYRSQGTTLQLQTPQLPVSSLNVDTIAEAELKANGFTYIRRTKLVCTIGPACCTLEQLDTMASAGMNIARLNMCHSTQEWHADVIHHIRKLNEEKGYSVAIMVDMECCDVHVGDAEGASTMNTQNLANVDFAINENVDFIALPTTEPQVIKHLKNYILARLPERSIRVLAKIESRESLEKLKDIIIASEGVVVARGALGSQVSLEQVPSVQQIIVELCRQLNRPVIVASQLLDSMTEYPTPTRAEVADVSDMVRQQVDALMLSNESAMGQYPCKSLGVLRTVSLRMEDWCRQEKLHEHMQLQQLGTDLSNKISEEICNSASLMANELKADAIFVYTKEGYMASLLSRNRPNCPIFAFTDSQDIRMHLSMLWGITPFGLRFSQDMETNLEITVTLLKARSVVKEGNLIIVVSDLAPSDETTMAQSVHIRRID